MDIKDKQPQKPGFLFYFLLATLIGSLFGMVLPRADAATTVVDGYRYSSTSIPVSGNERIVAKGGVVMSTTFSSTPTYQRNEGRGQITFGRYASNNVRLVFCNCYVSGGEKNGADDIIIKAALERVSTGEIVDFKFDGGLTEKRLAPGEYILTEAIPASSFAGLTQYAAGSTDWRWRTDTTVDTLGDKWPYNFEGVSSTTDFPVLSGERLGVSSNAVVSQIHTAGNLAIPSGGISTTQTFGPSGIIGEWVSTADISIFAQGDSVVYNQADTQDTGISGGGYFARGTRGVTGGQVPYILAAKSSEKAQDWANGHAFRQYLFRFSTHYFDNLGGADGLVGRTKAQIIADKQTIWNDFDSYSASPHWKAHSQIQPATLSSDSWKTLAGQTCYSGLSCSGQLRDQANADILALVGDANGPDQVYDPNVYWQDPVATTKWVVNNTNNYATADGRHPSSAMHVLAGGGLTTVINGWNAGNAPVNTVAPAVTGDPYVGATLTCSTGTWSFSPTSYTYSWEDAQGTISGATASTFVVTNDQLGENTNCSVVATNAYGSATAVDSNVIDIFTPTDIANMVAWYDASQPATISATSGSVDSWTNLVSANTCTATTTARPTTGSVTINGRNALDFDGSSDRLTCGANWGTTLFNDSDGATVVTAATNDTPATAAMYLWSCQLTGATIAGSGQGYINPNYSAQAASGNGLASYNITNSTAQHTISYRRGFGSAGTTQVIYDGTATAGTASTNYANTTCAIGNDAATSPSKYWNGAIGEVFVYTRALTNAEMNQLGAYMAYKWGIGWTTLASNDNYPQATRFASNDNYPQAYPKSVLRK